MESQHSDASGCGACSEGRSLPFEFTFAFQPIFDVSVGRVFSYEALVRGMAGEGALSILERVNDDNRYQFDQAVRTKSIALASKLGMRETLSINFLPNAVYKPELCIRSTMATAQRLNFPISRILFELSEAERITSPGHLRSIFEEYRRLGFSVAIDDFGAGYSGLNLLADYQPDYLKLDLQLVRGIHEDRSRQAIVRGIITVCQDLRIAIIAEGIEEAEEAVWLRDAGVNLFQGYFFARPGFETLPPISAAGKLLAGVSSAHVA